MHKEAAVDWTSLAFPRFHSLVWSHWSIITGYNIKGIYTAHCLVGANTRSIDQSINNTNRSLLVFKRNIASNERSETNMPKGFLGVRAIARNTYCFCSVFFLSSPSSSSSSPDRLSTQKHILANVTRSWNLACTYMIDSRWYKICDVMMRSSDIELR